MARKQIDLFLIDEAALRMELYRNSKIKLFDEDCDILFRRRFSSDFIRLCMKFERITSKDIFNFRNSSGETIFHCQFYDSDFLTEQLENAGVNILELTNNYGDTIFHTKNTGNLL